MKNITSFKRKYDPHFTWNTEKKIQFKPTTPALIYKTKFVNFPIQPMQWIWLLVLKKTLSKNKTILENVLHDIIALIDIQEPNFQVILK